MSIIAQGTVNKDGQEFWASVDEEDEYAYHLALMEDAHERTIDMIEQFEIITTGDEDDISRYTSGQQSFEKIDTASLLNEIDAAFNRIETMLSQQREILDAADVAATTSEQVAFEARWKEVTE